MGAVGLLDLGAAFVFGSGCLALVYIFLVVFVILLLFIYLFFFSSNAVFREALAMGLVCAGGAEGAGLGPGLGAGAGAGSVPAPRCWAPGAQPLGSSPFAPRCCRRTPKSYFRAPLSLRGWLSHPCPSGDAPSAPPNPERRCRELQQGSCPPAPP